MITAPNKLHLGCGAKFIEGYYHVDALPFEHIDRVGPVDNLDWLPANSCSVIYASHVLEHFGRKEVSAVLAEWCRVLTPGGILRLAVPDFGACVKLYAEGKVHDLVLITGLIVGGQRDQYDFHKMIFDETSLAALLHGAGFAKTRLWDWRTVEHSHVDDYSQAYLPHMDKENGQLVSLNMEAIK